MELYALIYNFKTILVSASDKTERCDLEGHLRQLHLLITRLILIVASYVAVADFAISRCKNT